MRTAWLIISTHNISLKGSGLSSVQHIFFLCSKYSYDVEKKNWHCKTSSLLFCNVSHVFTVSRASIRFRRMLQALFFSFYLPFPFWYQSQAFISIASPALSRAFLSHYLLLPCHPLLCTRNMGLSKWRQYATQYCLLTVPLAEHEWTLNQP